MKGLNSEEIEAWHEGEREGCANLGARERDIYVSMGDWRRPRDGLTENDYTP